MALCCSCATDSPAPLPSSQVIYDDLGTCALSARGILLAWPPVNTNTEDWDRQNQSLQMCPRRLPGKPSEEPGGDAEGRKTIKYCHCFLNMSSNRRAWPQPATASHRRTSSLFSRKTSPVLFQTRRMCAKRILCSCSQMSV